MMKDISNWGRWGAADEIGTFNLITPAKRREAAALVREGLSVSMAHTLDKEVLADNPTPFKIEFLMGPDGKMRAGRGDGRDRVDVSRDHDHPHGLALPLHLRGQDLQRLGD